MCMYTLRACSKWQYFDAITNDSFIWYVCVKLMSFVRSHNSRSSINWHMVVDRAALWGHLANNYIVWHGIWQRYDDKNVPMIQNMILYPHILRQRGPNRRIQRKLNVNCFDNNSYRCQIHCAFHENILFRNFVSRSDSIAFFFSSLQWIAQLNEIRWIICYLVLLQKIL